MTDSTAEGLLLAIRSRPDDDMPRLAYADWLEEHGEADRAEFIRVQIELAKIAWRCSAGSATPPLLMCPCGVCSLERRERELRGPAGVGEYPANVWEWFAVGMGRFGVEHYRDSRGFVSGVTMRLQPLFGLTCRRCEGFGERARYDHVHPPQPCWQCGSVGVVGGSAAALFGSHPVTHVDITDRYPLRHAFQRRAQCFWIVEHSERAVSRFLSTDVGRASVLPRALYMCLKGGTPVITRTDEDARGYPSAEAAMNDFVAASVDLGRAAAKLPPMG